MSMTPEEARSEALARFEASGAAHINCGQAVLLYGLLRLDEDPEGIIRAKYLGGGVAGMGEICGALNGFTMALGVRDQVLAEQGVDPSPATTEELRTVLRDFQEQFGALRCRDLTGYDLTDPESATAFHMSDLRSRCTDYVSWAIDRLEPLLEPAL